MYSHSRPDSLNIECQEARRRRLPPRVLNWLPLMICHTVVKQLFGTDRISKYWNRPKQALTTNQNSLFRSRHWLSANQGPVFLDSVGSCLPVSWSRASSPLHQITPPLS
eukprot:sb/3477354/